ncbi:MAG: bifunctional folylpolyglutamate synthase/dihydrofolate synthase, partial [Sphingobacterium sp.]
MKNYAEVIEYLFAQLPMFTRDGATAIDFDHDKTQMLCSALENPQNKFKSIHIAGTNGKGSSSHMLASVLSASGLKTGLYTSPHLVDFRERIRINGPVIPENTVVDFFLQNQTLIESIKPSFFELTVALAFDYFAKEKVDIAIIEVGLGGRLDSTNIITPELCLISNIGLDHMNILGDTLIEIAAEKAGIFKHGVPIVVSEKQEELVELFLEKANHKEAELTFATDRYAIKEVERKIDGLHIVINNLEAQANFSIISDLAGSYQLKNILGVLTCFDKLKELGYHISDDQIKFGLAHVQQETGLRGRWETLSNKPWIICDTGHNEDG